MKNQYIYHNIVCQLNLDKRGDMSKSLHDRETKTNKTT